MTKTAKPIIFKTTLVKPSDDSGWHFIPVEAKIAEKFEKVESSRRVVCTINDEITFQCALMPSGGEFFIIINKAKRDKLGIVAGDKITVSLITDDSKYGLPMPPEFKEVLKQDKVGDKLFHALTKGKQRSILYFLGKVKDIDKRIHQALIVIEHLKDNDGKIDDKKLQAELKRPIW